MNSVLNHMQFAVAPMVCQSDAPFRALCLKYGATITYTEMLYTSKIVSDPDYLDNVLPSYDTKLIKEEYSYKPLIVQVCGNDPIVMSKAVVIIASTRKNVGAIDINLGCPQDRARDGLFGSFLLDKQHWERVFSCVKACSESLLPFDVPFICKIRLIEGSDILSLTTQFCRGLIENGAKAICIHGRTRGSTKKRRCGPADLTTIATISKILQTEYPHIPVISNGNITSTSDVIEARKVTLPCAGVMSAEGILANPALFYGVPTHTSSDSTDNSNSDATDTTNSITSSRSSNETTRPPPSLLALFQEYCALSEEYRLLGGWVGLDAQYQRDHPAATTSTTTSNTTTSTATTTTTTTTSTSTATTSNTTTSTATTTTSTATVTAATVTATSVIVNSTITSNVAAATTDTRDIGNKRKASEENASDPTILTQETHINKYTAEPRQIYIARQHLNWLLRKSGHGRMVRYEYIGSMYQKHVHLMQALNEAKTIQELLYIAATCFC